MQTYEIMEILRKGKEPFTICRFLLLSCFIYRFFVLLFVFIRIPPRLIIPRKTALIHIIIYYAKAKLYIT